MNSIGTITLPDLARLDAATAIVEAGVGCVALTISLRRGADVMVALGRADAASVRSLFDRALRSGAARESRRSSTELELVGSIVCPDTSELTDAMVSVRSSVDRISIQLAHRDERSVEITISREDASRLDRLLALALKPN